MDKQEIRWLKLEYPAIVWEDCDLSRKYANRPLSIKRESYIAVE